MKTERGPKIFSKGETVNFRCHIGSDGLGGDLLVLEDFYKKDRYIEVLTPEGHRDGLPLQSTYLSKNSRYVRLLKQVLNET